MSTVWADDVDGLAAGSPTLDAYQAGRLLGLNPSHVLSLVRRGKISARRVGRFYVLDRASVEAYGVERSQRRAAMRRIPPQPPVADALPAEPLLRAIRARGGRRAVGVGYKSAEEKALQRAARDGWVTEQMADRLVTRLLGLTPWEVWGA